MTGNAQEGAPRVFRWLVAGRVQGVAFRWFTCRTATKLGLRGTVRNLTDGRVEIVAVEPPDPQALQAFRASVEKGPPTSRVDGIEPAEVSDTEAAALRSRQSFDIVY